MIVKTISPVLGVEEFHYDFIQAYEFFKIFYVEEYGWDAEEFEEEYDFSTTLDEFEKNGYFELCDGDKFILTKGAMI